jgi:energy-coupling factor transporter ATP-binding protein EcfA2
MITNITLENFKCFRKVDVNPRLITVFVGPNGSGKSSVLQAMALLKQSVGTNAIQFNGNLINLESPDDFFPKFTLHALSSRIEFGGFARHPNLSDPPFGELVGFRYIATVHRQGPVIAGGDLQFPFESEPHFVKMAVPSHQETIGVVIGKSRARFNPGTTIARPVDLAGLDREDTPHSEQV